MLAPRERGIEWRLPLARLRVKVVQRHIPSFTEPQARAVIKTWLKNGVLVREDYQDAAEGKKRQGVRVDNAKRPG